MNAYTSCQIKYHWMLIAGGAFISGASSKMVTARKFSRGFKYYLHARMEEISFFISFLFASEFLSSWQLDARGRRDNTFPSSQVTHSNNIQQI